ncbi:MAG: hypothetical protein LPH21_12575 [Shewanella sp.]|nr:hypothetical protein [Shewanella sp.]
MKVKSYISNQNFGGVQARPSTSVASELNRLSQAGFTLGAVVKRAQIAESTRQRDSVLIRAEAFLDDEIQQIGQKPSWTVHEPAYEDAVKRISEWARDQFSEEEDFHQWDTKFQLSVAKGRVKMHLGAMNRMKDEAVTQSTMDLSTLANAAAREPSPEGQKIIKDRGLALIDAQLSNGVISHAEHLKMKRQFENELVGSNIRELIRLDPVEAVIRLQDASDPIFDGLPADTREVWISRALSAYEQNLRRQDISLRRAERQLVMREKALARDLAKEADELAANGTLDETWLFENRAYMNPSDFRYHLEGLVDERREVATSQLYVQLSRRALAGEDVQEEADAALILGLLDKSHRETIHDLVESREGPAMSWSKSTRLMLLNHFGSDEILSKIPGGPDRKAEALHEWDIWYLKNKGSVTMDQGITKAHDILSKWHMKPEVLNVFSMQRFRYGPAINTPDMDLSEIAKKTKDAYDRGELSAEQYQEEVRKLRDMTDLRASLENQPND